MPEARDVTVVIPAYRAAGTLDVVLRALEPQIARVPGAGAVLVDSTGDGSGRVACEPFPWLEVVELPSRVLPGRARNEGARRGGGAWLAFLDADAVPAADWLERLLAAVDAHPAAVAIGGAVINGSPASRIGTASHLLEFSEFSARRSGTPLHLASANLLVRREFLLAAGGFREDVFPGEDTIATMPWARRGSVAFQPDAVVVHLGRTSMRAMLDHEVRLGRAFVAVCDSVEHPFDRFSRWPLLCIAGPMRLVALVIRVARHPGELADVGRCLPGLVAGLCAWTAGVVLERARVRRRLRAALQVDEARAVRTPVLDPVDAAGADLQR